MPPLPCNTVAIVTMAISVLNVILHSSGAFLLVSTMKRNKRSCQHLYLINLASTQLTKHVLNFFLLLHMYDLIKISHKWASFNYFLSCACVYFLYIPAMFFITGDRLLMGIYGMRYTAVCTRHKTIVLLGTKWMLYIVNIYDEYTLS